MTSVTNPITRLRAPKAISTEIIPQELKPIAPDIDARIANTLIKCQADTLTPVTVKAIKNSLRQLARQANLLDPEDVKVKVSTAINTKTKKPTTPETKNRLLYAYDKFCKYNAIQWTKPYYKTEEKTPLARAFFFTVLFRTFSCLPYTRATLSGLSSIDIRNMKWLLHRLL